MDFKDTINFKISSSDKNELLQKAKNMRLTLSGYIRYKIFNN
jgi:hypothetical protein